MDIPSVAFFCQSGHLIDRGINFLIENFTGLSIMNFIANYESEIVNQLGLQRNLSEN